MRSLIIHELALSILNYWDWRIFYIKLFYVSGTRRVIRRRWIVDESILFIRYNYRRFVVPSGGFFWSETARYSMKNLIWIFSSALILANVQYNSQLTFHFRIVRNGTLPVNLFSCRWCHKTRYRRKSRTCIFYFSLNSLFFLWLKKC